MTDILLIVLLAGQTARIQTDWVSGPGVRGPVSDFGSAFFSSESVSYNVSGQVSPVTNARNCSLWVKHLIDSTSGIDGHSGIYPADFDGDGDLDLAGWIAGDTVLRIYRNNLVETGAVNYTRQLDLTGGRGGPSCLIWCGDLNGDGRPDIVVPSAPQTSAVNWFENQGGFRFVSHLVGTRSYASGCCDCADVDRDGDMDIVCGDRPLELWRNDGHMNFTREFIASGLWWRVTLADLNGDSFPDLLNSGDVYLNHNGTFSSAPDWTSNLAGPDGHSIRDFNNDGKKDLLVSDEWGTPQTLYWYENGGTGRSFTQHVVYDGPNAGAYGDGCIAEDIDGDGLTDVVGSHTRVGFFRQAQPGVFTEIPVDLAFNESHWVYAANLDYRPNGQDLDLDILASGQTQFAWWENQMSLGYAASAELISSILAPVRGAIWQRLSWDAARPTGTFLDFYVRTSLDSQVIESLPWRGPISVRPNVQQDSADLAPYTNPGDRYFQYRIRMGGGILAPVVYSVAVTYLDDTYDVGVERILAPGGIVDFGATIGPVAVIQNYGTVPASFPVHFRIGNDYRESAFVALPAGECDTVSFPNWIAHPYGTLAVSCTTAWASDGNRTNNLRQGTVTVASRDAGTIRITAPRDSVAARDRVTPAAIVHNYGNVTQDFDAVFQIGNQYCDTVHVPGLPVGADRTIAFAPWVAVLGQYATSCSTMCALDVAPQNDKVGDSIKVVQRTVGVAIMPDAFDSIEAGGQRDYLCTVHNLGNGQDVLDIELDRVSSSPGWSYQLLDRFDIPLADANLNGLPDVGAVGPSGAAEFKLRVKSPDGARQGLADTVRVWVLSGYSPPIRADITVRTLVAGRITGLVIAPDVSDRQPAGEARLYALEGLVQGNMSDVIHLSAECDDTLWGIRLLDEAGQQGIDELGPLEPGVKRQFKVSLAAPESSPNGLTGAPDSFSRTYIRIIGQSRRDPGLADTALLTIQLIPGLGIHNYENPFHERTMFVFSVPRPGRVRLLVYDRTGELVRQLIPGDLYRDFGVYTASWDATNSKGLKLSPGTYVYVYELTDKDTKQLVGRVTKKLMIR
jgi:hypothetical protein